MNAVPQQTFQINCNVEFPIGKYSVLSWNDVGMIFKREEQIYTSIDIEFHDKAKHRSI